VCNVNISNIFSIYIFKQLNKSTTVHYNDKSEA